MTAENRKNLILFCAAFLCGALALRLAEHTGLPLEGQRLLGTLAVIMVLWSTSCVGLGASCLLLLVLMTASVADFSGMGTGPGLGEAFKKSLVGFTYLVPMAVIAGTAFAAVLRASGLAERIVYGIMKAVSGKDGTAAPGRILGAIFLAELPISLMIPAAIGRCAMYMSIAEGFEKPMHFSRLDSGEPGNPFQKAVWMAITFVPIIMGSAFLTAAEATIMAGAFITQSTGLPQYWMTTFCLLFLPALGAMVIAWVVLCRLFPSNMPNLDASVISGRLREIGPLRYGEKYCIGVLLAMVCLFLTDTAHGAPAPLILVLAGFSLFIPGIGAGDWKRDRHNIAWESAFIVAVALSFSHLLGEYGIMDYFAGKVNDLAITRYPLVLLAVIASTLLIRLGIASIASATALLVPMALVVGTGAGLSPEKIAALGWIAYVFCRLSFFLPHQGAHLIMTHGRGFYSTKDLFRAASWIISGCVILYTAWGALAMEPILKLVR